MKDVTKTLGGTIVAVLRFSIGGVCALLAVIVLASPLSSQVVKLSESDMTPYRKVPESEGSANTKPSAYLYAAVRPGTTGTLSGPKVTAVGERAKGFAYPSLDFVFSAASRVITDGPSSNADSATRALAEISRINAHVHIDAPDASRTSGAIRENIPSVLVLMIAPEDVSLAQSAPSRAAEIATGVEFAARFMGPLGELVSGFQASHKASRAPAQIAYQSSDNEFGWTWYESPETPIEGLHRCAALLEVPASVTSLHVTIELITDWRHSGPWKKSFEFQVPVVLPPPTK